MKTRGDTPITRPTSNSENSVTEDQNGAPVTQSDSINIKLSEEDEKRVEDLQNKIDIYDVDSILNYGSESESNLSRANEGLLSDIKTSDSTGAEDILETARKELTSIDTNNLRTEEDFKGLKGKLRKYVGRQKENVSEIIEQFDTSKEKIDNLRNKMIETRTALRSDIRKIDKLVKNTMDYYHELNLHIEAGEREIKRLYDEVVPEKEQKAEDTNDPVIQQELSDLYKRITDLEKKIHNMKLVQQATVQSIPTARKIQEVNTNMAEQLRSLENTTIPIWENNVITSVAIKRQKEGGKVIHTIKDLTGNMIEQNSKDLYEAVSNGQSAVERGVIAVESLQQANENLIKALDKSIEISEKGKQERLKAESTLNDQRNKLKNRLQEGANQIAHQSDDTRKLVRDD